MRTPLLASTHCALLAGALLACTAQAATLQMSVTNAEGKPAPDTVVQVQPTASWAPQPLPPAVTIEQKDIRFVPYVTVVPVGGAVHFTNLDTFDHHVRSQPGGPLGSVAPAKDFEFRLPSRNKGNNKSPDLRLDVAGSILIGCHLHNSMRGHLFISSTPWYGVSDAQGKVRIEGVPDGQAEVKVWHPDQLSEQASQRLQLTGSVNAETKLNFTPRRRAAPPRELVDPRGEYR
jgi:plastocyanin